MCAMVGMWDSKPADAVVRMLSGFFDLSRQNFRLVTGQAAPEQVERGYPVKHDEFVADAFAHAADDFT